MNDHHDDRVGSTHGLTESTSTEAIEPASHALPALGRIVRLVESALTARDADTVVAQIASRLGPIMRETASQLPQDFTRPGVDGYRRIELQHCPLQGYQIIAMVWGPGQGTRIHDHEATWGVEAVWQGSLLVADFALRETRGELFRLDPAGAAHLSAGEIATITPDRQVHLCSNPSRRDVTVTLHIYGCPLDTCGEYLPVEKEGWYERRETPLTTE